MEESLTPLEILQKAIKSEIGAYQFYDKLQKIIESNILKKKLNFLKNEEKKHKKLLKKIFKILKPDFLRKKLFYQKKALHPYPHLMCSKNYL